jgi:hypothetical protein
MAVSNDPLPNPPRLLIAASLVTLAMTLLWWAQDLAGAIAGGQWPLVVGPAGGLLIGRDFVNMHQMAQIAWSGDLAANMKFEAYWARLREAFGAQFSPHALSYPPHLALLVLPLGFLPYTLAYGVWTLGGVIALAAAGRAAGLRGAWLLLLLGAPACAIALWGGQNGLYTAALMLGGWALRDRRPWVAGLLFGLLTVKPQLGLLVPVLLMIEGRWRVIAAAGLTTLGLIGLSIGLWGVEPWRLFFTEVAAFQMQILTEWKGVFVAMMPSAYAAAVSLGMTSVAPFAQAAAGALGLAAAGLIFWRTRDDAARMLAVGCATITLSPYVFVYDLGFVSAAVLLLAMRGHASWAGAALFALPVLAVAMARTGVPIAPVILVGAFAAFALAVRPDRAPWPRSTGRPILADTAP